MLPIRHRSIFKSRWIALLWAAGIVWSAVSFVGPGADAGDAGGDANAGAVAASG